MRKPVLVVIVTLNDFLARWASTDREQFIENINDLVATVRKTTLPVIWVR